ncbi:hypothetical protein DFH28DRAFT_862330, partial [Melampsora americana]
SQPPCPDCGRDFPLRPTTKERCDCCEWRETHGTVCQHCYCHLCGVVFKYLEGNHCSTCSKSPLALASNPPQTVTPLTVSVPQQPFQPPIPMTSNPNDLPDHLFASNTVIPPAPLSFPGIVQQASSSASGDFSNRQAEELARLLTSKNRTNWPKPPIKKAVLQPKPSQTLQAPKRHGKIKMSLLYFKNSRKTQHPLDPKMCKINLDDPHWYMNLYLEAWLWFCDEAEKLKWPPLEKMTGKDKLVPLPPWDDRYCQIVDNSCFIEKNDLQDKIEEALKKSTGLASLRTIGISFNWYNYHLSIAPNSTKSDSEDESCKATISHGRKRSRHLVSSDGEESSLE